MTAGHGFGPGERVADRYRVVALLGRGGMGSVWRAIDEMLDREVALKRIRLDAPTDAAPGMARERVLREARIAAKLHHPHLVSIFDIVERDELWLVLEYVAARNLADLLAERRALPPNEVAAIGAQIAAALAAAHDAGVVHRDVKPENVLVADPSGGRDPLGRAFPVVKLTDFGISRALDTPTLTVTGVLTGTPAYFAPETARGEGSDPRTDVYSLGATLYAAAEGHPPFGSDPDNVLTLLARIGRGGAPPPRQAGPLTPLLGWLLHDDPNARPTAVQAQHALQELAAATPVRPPVTPPPAGPAAIGPPPGSPAGHPFPPPPVQAPRPVRRRARHAVVAAVAATALAVTVTVLATRDSRTGDPPPVAAPATSTASPPGNRSEIVLGDAMTADPCSLVDLAAMSRHGTPRIDREYGRYAACRVDLREDVGFFVTLENAAENGAPLSDTSQSVGPLLLARYDSKGWRCTREVQLSDGNMVELHAETWSDPPAGDICEIADTGMTAAVNTLLWKGLGIRIRLDAERPLAGVDACSLLQPPDLAVVPDLAGTVGVPRLAHWGCGWGTVEGGKNLVVADFFRDYPLDGSRRTPAVFHGREGVIGGERDGSCRATIVQGDAVNGSRIDAVRIMVWGPQPEAERCEWARALANAAAARLPADG